MNLKLSLAAGALATSVICAVPGMAANSASLGALKDIGASQASAVEQAALWSRRCHWGIGGYHKWVPGVGRVQCTAQKCWINRWGIKRCRWF